jgi:hypothetical protein
MEESRGDSGRLMIRFHNLIISLPELISIIIDIIGQLSTRPSFYLIYASCAGVAVVAGEPGGVGSSFGGTGGACVGLGGRGSRPSIMSPI